MTAPAATAPQADTKDATEAGTEYVILTLDESGMWDRNAKDYARNVTARSAEQAVRKHVELRAAKQGGVVREGTFVAIPAKSWKRITVTPQTVTTLEALVTPSSDNVATLIDDVRLRAATCEVNDQNITASTLRAAADGLEALSQQLSEERQTRWSLRSRLDNTHANATGRENTHAAEIQELVQDKAILLTLLTEGQMDEYRRRRSAVRDGEAA
jgi:hypothetical protein